jgi:SSS family solute:Na+ symporter/sodium/pantothenate symporter
MRELLPLFALIFLMLFSLIIGAAASRAAERGGFLRGYFLGNRGLGAWSMALTATVMSGGTFMGFPSLVYQYGWVLALWIGSYMMVPLCTFAILGKRMGQISRQTGAITVPELLREQFRSPALGVTASALMVFLLAFNMIAQFKGGAIILQKVLPAIPGITDASWTLGDKSPAFLYGLVIFTLVVVTYTVCGGFLAAVWTDVFQSILMAIGVLILFPLALAKSGGLAAGTMAGIEAAGPGFAFAPGANREFLPLTLAFSFFVMWPIAGLGQPATLVRLMAFRNMQTLRYAIFLLAIYNTLIYLPLVFTFICARAILPGLERPDEVMPTLALTVASPAVAGLVLSAPFGAVMATVSAFLVQISSAIVQDIYHRWLNPRASERTLRRASHLSIVLVALAAAVGTVFSPKFLQAIIVFTGGAAACAFLVPALMAAYWPRASARGAMAAMLGGVVTVLALYLLGLLRGTDPGIGEKSNFFPIYLFGVAPFVWGLLVSMVLGVVVSLADTRPLEPAKTCLERISARHEQTHRGRTSR